jgi:hypothetical protein
VSEAYIDVVADLKYRCVAESKADARSERSVIGKGRETRTDTHII